MMFRKLRAICYIIWGIPVMYRMQLKPERLYDNKVKNYYNVITVLNKGKKAFIENRFW